MNVHSCQSTGRYVYIAGVHDRRSQVQLLFKTPRSSTDESIPVTDRGPKLCDLSYGVYTTVHLVSNFVQSMYLCTPYASDLDVAKMAACSNPGTLFTTGLNPGPTSNYSVPVLKKTRQTICRLVVL